jgi:predicted transcriptional regulator
VAESPEEVSLAELTTQIVTAYVSHNLIPTGELGQLISAVAGQIRRIGSEPEQPAQTKPEPAIPVRRSIRPDHLVCLVCGNKQKLLKRHLAVEHGLTPDQYRRTFDLAPDYPMAAPNYRQQRRELALQIGLGRPKKPVRKGRKSTAPPLTAGST